MRAAGLTHVALMFFGLVAPLALFGPWGLPTTPPTFYRIAIVVLGTLGVALVRAAGKSVAEGRLLVETCGLAMLAFFCVLLADATTHVIPGLAPLAGAVDLVFGTALFRIARRA